MGRQRHRWRIESRLRLLRASPLLMNLFLNKKPKTKDWKKYLIFRDEWSKYRERFYTHCRGKAEKESDATMRKKLISLGRKVKKVDDEMERHAEMLKEVQDGPMNINAIFARRRADFTEEFFRHLTVLSDTLDGLEDRDGKAQLERTVVFSVIELCLQKYLTVLILDLVSSDGYARNEILGCSVRV